MTTDLEPSAESRFHRLGELGRGETTIVELIYDEERQAQLARKRWPRTSAELRFRLKQQFRRAQAIEHRNLVRLYELSVEANETSLTMEAISGGEVVAHMQALAQSGCDDAHYIAVAVDVLRQLTEALIALHDAGLVHRDIKPRNVLIESSGRVVLLDAGFAWPPQQHFDPQRDRVLAATLPYLSPECLRGALPSEEADWYSFGALAAELLSGRAPFSGSLDAVLRAKDAPFGTLREACPAVPELLDELVCALLIRDPSARPTAIEVQEVLAELAAELPSVSLAADGGGQSAALLAGASTAPAEDVVIEAEPSLAAPAVSMVVERSGERLEALALNLELELERSARALEPASPADSAADDRLPLTAADVWALSPEPAPVSQAQTLEGSARAQRSTPIVHAAPEASRSQAQTLAASARDSDAQAHAHAHVNDESFANIGAEPALALAAEFAAGLDDSELISRRVFDVPAPAPMRAPAAHSEWNEQSAPVERVFEELVSAADAEVLTTLDRMFDDSAAHETGGVSLEDTFAALLGSSASASVPDDVSASPLEPMASAASSEPADERPVVAVLRAVADPAPLAALDDQAEPAADGGDRLAPELLPPDESPHSRRPPSEQHELAADDQSLSASVSHTPEPEPTVAADSGETRVAKIDSPRDPWLQRALDPVLARGASSALPAPQREAWVDIAFEQSRARSFDELPKVSPPMLTNDDQPTARFVVSDAWIELALDPTQPLARVDTISAREPWAALALDPLEALPALETEDTSSDRPLEAWSAREPHELPEPLRDPDFPALPLYDDDDEAALELADVPAAADDALVDRTHEPKRAAELANHAPGLAEPSWSASSAADWSPAMMSDALLPSESSIDTEAAAVLSNDSASDPQAAAVLSSDAASDPHAAAVLSSDAASDPHAAAVLSSDSASDAYESAAPPPDSANDNAAVNTSPPAAGLAAQPPAELAITAADGGSTALPAQRSPGPAGPRITQLEQRLRSTPTPQLLLLRGYAGSGKTELLRALCERIGAGRTLVMCSGESATNTAFEPVRALLRQLSPLLRSCTFTLASERAAALQTILPELAPILAQPADQTPAAPETQRRWIDAVLGFRALFRQLSARHPLLIAIDDAHALDLDSAHLLRALLAVAPLPDVLWLMTQRAECELPPPLMAAVGSNPGDARLPIAIHDMDPLRSSRLSLPAISAEPPSRSALDEADAPTLMAAAEDASRALALQRAAELHARVLRSAGSASPPQLEAAATALVRAGRLQEASETFLTAARQTRDPLQAQHFELSAGAALLRAGVETRGRELLQSVLQICNLGWPRAPLLTSTLERARLLLHSHRPRIPVQDAPGRRRRFDALWHSARELVLVAPVTGDALSVRALREALMLGDASRLAWALGYEAASAANIGGSFMRRRASTLVNEMSALAQQSGTPFDTAYARSIQGVVAFLSGDWYEAERLLRSALRGFASAPEPTAHEQHLVGTFLVSALEAQGKLEALLELLPELQLMAAETGHRTAHALYALAETALPSLAGDRALEAIARADAVLAELGGEGFSPLHFQHFVVTASARLYAGHYAQAFQQVEQTWQQVRHTYLPQLDAVSVMLHQLRARAALALAKQSSVHEAERLMKHAAKVAHALADSSLPHALALRHVVDANLALLRGRPAQADAHCWQASQCFEGAGMTLMSEVARHARAALAETAEAQTDAARCRAYFTRIGIVRPSAFTGAWFPAFGN